MTASLFWIYVPVDQDLKILIHWYNGVSILEEDELGIHEFLPPKKTAALGRMHAGPNPFSTSLSISLEQLNASAPVSALHITDQSGAPVTELPVSGSTVRWDGRNRNGITMPAGVYFAVPEPGADNAVIRIIKAK